MGTTATRKPSSLKFAQIALLAEGVVAGLDHRTVRAEIVTPVTIRTGPRTTGSAADRTSVLPKKERLWNCWKAAFASSTRRG